MGPRPGNVLDLAAPRGEEWPEDLAARVLRSPRLFAALRQGLADAPEVAIHPFFPDASHFELADRLRTELGIPVRVCAPALDVARRLVRKDVVRDAARELGVPVAPGEVVRLQKDHGFTAARRLRVAAERMLDRTGRVIVRGALSAGGSALTVLDAAGRAAEQALEELLERTGQSVWLVDAFYEPECSANVQFYVEPNGDRVRCIAATDQRFHGAFAYDGNAWPSRAERLPSMVQAALRMGEWYAEQGGVGPAGLDCVEYRHPQTGKLEWILAEMNPRINASAYLCALVERVDRRPRAAGREPTGGFVSSGLRTDPADFGTFRERFGELFYDEDRRAGMIPFSVGTLPDGKLDAAFLAPSRQQAEELCREAVNHAAGD